MDHLLQCFLDSFRSNTPETILKKIYIKKKEKLKSKRRKEEVKDERNGGGEVCIPQGDCCNTTPYILLGSMVLACAITVPLRSARTLGNTTGSTSIFLIRGHLRARYSELPPDVLPQFFNPLRVLYGRQISPPPLAGTFFPTSWSLILATKVAILCQIYPCNPPLPFPFPSPSR